MEYILVHSLGWLNHTLPSLHPSHSCAVTTSKQILVMDIRSIYQLSAGIILWLHNMPKHYMTLTMRRYEHLNVLWHHCTELDQWNAVYSSGFSCGSGQLLISLDQKLESVTRTFQEEQAKYKSISHC